jgi:glycosyltransferase involved in cell wall biosynthesis
MKILYYNHTGQVSGAERVLLMILSRLDRSRFEPVVACPTEGRLIGMVRELGIRAIGLEQLEARFTWNFGRLFQYLGSFARVIRNARALIIDEQPDVIHANSIRAGLVMSAASFGLAAPIIWHAHDILPRHPLSIAVRSFACTSGRSSILAVSQAAARRFRGNLIRWFSRRIPIRVIHNAVDLERFQPNSEGRREIRHALGLTEKDKVVGIVGHLTRSKGQLELIDAFTAISRETPDAVLLIIGETLFNRGDDYRKQLLMRAASSCAGADRIRFLGARDDVPALMRGIDLLVVNSHTEAFALTVLEGLASGTAILATAVDGTPEMIRHGENGWLVPARDPQTLAEAMLLLLNDQDLRVRLGSNGRREAMARFSVERFTNEIHSFYRGLLESGRTPHESARRLAVKMSAD